MKEEEEEEGLYYPCGQNKGADQLHSYCEADVHLCFRLCRLVVCVAQIVLLSIDNGYRVSYFVSFTSCFIE